VLEFALTIPIFFFVIMGTIEFSRSMFAANELNHLAREAVRYATVRSDQSDSPTGARGVAKFVRTRAAGVIADEIKVSTTWTPTNSPGAFVEVSLQYEFEPAVPFLPDALKNLRGYARGVVSN
jgi:Flp pilus assembly protein TadG